PAARQGGGMNRDGPKVQTETSDNCCSRRVRRQEPGIFRNRESGTTAGARAAPAPEVMGPSTDHAALFADERRLVWSLCYRMTGSAADADDLTQETFLRAIERPPVRTDMPWRPWLVRV